MSTLKSELAGYRSLVVNGLTSKAALNSLLANQREVASQSPSSVIDTARIASAERTIVAITTVIGEIDNG